MNNNRIAQTNQQQKSEAFQGSGTLQRAAIRSIGDAGVQLNEKEAQSLSNSAFSKDFSRVPISTTKPQPIMKKLMIGAVGDKYEQEADRGAKQRSPLPPQQLPQDTATETSSAWVGEGVLQAKREIIGNSQGVSEESRRNHTGLPDSLKTGIENLSGISMDDVRVHYNSEKPAQLQAHAYTQGTDIHVASGQQKHLPHEIWHVVQQKQGRVKPTMQGKEKVEVNNEEGLEKEADLMGKKALERGGRKIGVTTQGDQNPTKNEYTRKVCQLVGLIRFTNLSQDEEATKKAQQIKVQLYKSSEIYDYLANKDCVIRIENPFNAITPAEVVVVAGQVQVKIAPWFFDTSEVGEIIGMLAHEFAVHPMADEKLGPQVVENEEAQAADQQEMDSYYTKPSLNFFSQKQTYKLKVDQGNQRDHLFMVKKDEPRAIYYREVTYELVSALWESYKKKTNNITLDHVKQAIISYLGDVAMTVISNDQKNKIAPTQVIQLGSAIKEAMNYWKEICEQKGEEGQRIWNVSQEWRMGVTQAVSFIEKQANRNNNPTRSQNNEEEAQGSTTANQNETLTAMGWVRERIHLDNDAGVQNFFTQLTMVTTVPEPLNTMQENLTPENIENVNPLIRAIQQVPGAHWPNLDEAKLCFLGRVLEVGIYVIRRNGLLEAVSRGNGQIIVIERADNDGFSFVPV